jgi:hypothetical protein
VEKGGSTRKKPGGAMKVKIGDTVYDGAEEPVMVILSPEDKQNIASMLPDATKYCSYPDSMSDEDAVKFMQNDKKKADI